ncbi:MAG TPA: hypothetical protein VFM48_06625 [Aquabacterium sp.]|nr:hypothetical protein [Aquabacterium sp.]
MILSPIDKEILQALAEGQSQKQVAETVCRSHKTIEDRLLIMRRVHRCDTTTELVAKALSLGVIGTGERPMNTLESIKNWFEAAVPAPDDANRGVQHGCHLEEVAEMCEAVGDNWLKEDILDIAEFYKSGNIALRDLSPKEHIDHLDSICDQIVTLIGKAHMHGYDIAGALAEVDRSNWSKFVDGKPVFNEQGKIAKGPDYSKPDLTKFVEGAK